jgi:F-type H+-transporting ATPase subunit gamma
MPSTRDIRRRIKGVKNIRQVTKAMNMIAAARLRRAQTKAEAARPYADRLSAILQDVLASGASGRHPLLAQRPVKKVAIIIVSSDRGLCGAFNAGILREAGRFVEEQKSEVGVITIGRKSREFFQRLEISVDQAFPQPSRDVRLEEVGAIGKQIISDYSTGKYDQIHLAYSRFISVLKNVPTVTQLLPIPKPGGDHDAAAAAVRTVAYQFEPQAEELLGTLLPQYVEVLMYGALVESLASEQAARMVAMKSATDSASDMIDALTRKYNRVRQTAITTQILEVVSGAEALEN